MNFLEAHRTVAGFRGGPPLPLLLAMSGTADPLVLFVRAVAARAGRAADVAVLPFNTLLQAMMAPKSPDRAEVLLLFPWDLVGELDWRTGSPAEAPSVELALARAHARMEGFARRGSPILYVPAPTPPVFATPAEGAAARAGLVHLATTAGARLLPDEIFSLGSTFASGCPIAGARMGEVAAEMVDAALAAQAALASEPAKVVVTDLDNVMWSGVVGEDGVAGLQFRPEAKGWRHFVYQTVLRRLKGEGVLLAAVSRNDPADARAPLEAGEMVLSDKDFVAVVASYEPKSAQIAELARQLNLGLDSLVFVDDNPIELAEVGAALPGLECHPFPTADEGLPAFLDRLCARFAKTRASVTDEDRHRTDMYRARLQGLMPVEGNAGDVSGFLAGLEMVLTLRDATAGDCERAVQLINKTNQFNLNGRRVTDAEVAAIVDAGGRLFTARLSDRHGDHGEVLACLIDGEGTAQSLVMSCRVFQRRVEHAFLCLLARLHGAPRRLAWVETPRNEPFAKFLSDPAFAQEGPLVAFDTHSFLSRHGAALDLISVSGP